MKMRLKTEIKVTCPKCNSEFITSLPEKMLWERCNACLSYIWEADDLMMEAGELMSYKQNRKAPSFTANH
jgi:hypothetical protein